MVVDRSSYSESEGGLIAVSKMKFAGKVNAGNQNRALTSQCQFTHSDLIAVVNRTKLPGAALRENIDTKIGRTGILEFFAYSVAEQPDRLIDGNRQLRQDHDVDPVRQGNARNQRHSLRVLVQVPKQETKERH